ncbi:hypothetical protein [Actinomadura livida]|uniref:Uncharacterized protein n=1 Tax=Actinomadura livida TaxID=79909 RepID=A0A7W7ICW8_9ACTN|nr:MULTISPECIES: hypothetical protein [Actinomadura]MBB4774569.1 hypothetical protein [Actinomadura catellatispora]GGU07419.1 hypothetical protein GCM10010208_35110 [Actinomadura livida]
MDSPDEQLLKQTIERLTQENAKLRSQLAVTEQWNPPLELEHAFRTAMGWECVTVPLIPEEPTLILISGTEPGTGGDGAAAGEVWRHLQTAAPPRGRIGPYARAQMPGRLLGYLRVHGDRTVIVLNRDLRRGQVSRAARILRSNAKMRHPRLLELSAVPLLALSALYQGGSAKSLVGLSAAAAPAATIVLSIAIAPSTGPYPENQPSIGRTHPTSHVTQSDEKTARRSSKPPESSAEKLRKTLAAESSGTTRAAPAPACPDPVIPTGRPPLPTPTPSASPSLPPPLESSAPR